VLLERKGGVERKFRREGYSYKRERGLKEVILRGKGEEEKKCGHGARTLLECGI